MLFHLLTATLIEDWPLVVRTALLASCVTALMTWAVMPRLAKLLAGWLYPGSRCFSPR